MNKLVTLDLSGGKLHFNVKSTQFFDLVNFTKNSTTLKELNLSKTNIPIETLLELLDPIKLEGLDVRYPILAIICLHNPVTTSSETKASLL